MLEHLSSPIVILVDALIHSDEQPFCCLDECPCHTDPSLLAPVHAAVAAGLLTPDEARLLVLGRLLWQGVPFRSPPRPQVRRFCHELATTLALSRLDASCLTLSHVLRPAWTEGEFFCEECGAKLYCPLCVSAPPKKAQFALCSTHRATDRTQRIESEEES